jgi:L-lactate dehydrogenase
MNSATLGVIGAGRVGRAVTAAIVTTDPVSHILVHSRRRLESIALATDATDLAATQHAPTRIDAVDHPRELRDATLLIVCIRARFTNPTQDRRGGLLPNAPLIADLAHQLRGFPGPVVMVSNPVDVMSRVFAEHSDTAVLGIIRQQLRERSTRITAGMDRTQHGPAGAVLSTVRKLLGLADGHEELSATSPNGVYLGQRLRFVAGLYRNDPPEHSPAEQTALEASRHRLQTLYDHILTHR